MIAVKVPNISANEDVVTIVEIKKDNNDIIKRNDIICVLETTKALLELEAEAGGYICFIAKGGDEVKTGDIIAFIDDKKMDANELLRFSKSKDEEKLVVTKKAKILLEKFNLASKEIMDSGVLKASNVEKYLHQTKPEEESIDSLYTQLERVMKSYETKTVELKDVKKLKNTLALLSDIYSKKWNRNIPVVDILFDRWAAGKKLNFGENCNISHLSYVIGDVVVGKNTFIGPFTILDGSGDLEIGDYCSIATGVHIYSHDTISRALSGHRSQIVRSPTKIGNCCFVGPNAVITKGVKIDDHCFIAPNSVVLSNVPSFTAVMGNPAKKVGKVVISEEGQVTIVKKQ